jgi:hypothetical protein
VYRRLVQTAVYVNGICEVRALEACHQAGFKVLVVSVLHSFVATLGRGWTTL